MILEGTRAEIGKQISICELLGIKYTIHTECPKADRYKYSLDISIEAIKKIRKVQQVIEEVKKL